MFLFTHASLGGASRPCETLRFCPRPWTANVKKMCARNVIQRCTQLRTQVWIRVDDARGCGALAFVARLPRCPPLFVRQRLALRSCSSPRAVVAVRNHGLNRRRPTRRRHRLRPRSRPRRMKCRDRIRSASPRTRCPPATRSRCGIPPCMERPEPSATTCATSRPRRSRRCSRAMFRRRSAIRASVMPPPRRARSRSCCSVTASPASGCSRRTSRRTSRRGAWSWPRPNTPAATCRTRSRSRPASRRTPSTT